MSTCRSKYSIKRSESDTSFLVCCSWCLYMRNNLSFLLIQEAKEPKIEKLLDFALTSCHRGWNYPLVQKKRTWLGKLTPLFHKTK